MHDFLIKKIIINDLENELQKIGFDESYINKAKNKFSYLNLKIFGLSCVQANILKQTGLSVGADCATNKMVILGNAEKSDVILGGSVSQIYKIAQKLKSQPFGLKKLGEEIEEHASVPGLKIKTKIMGILNLTRDSFSDGGQYFDYDSACNHLIELISDGADIIDIGAESTRPGAKPVSEDEQLDKILPVLDYIKSNNLKIPISIDTRSSKVAEECLKNGANIINDVSGFDYDEKMPDILARYPFAQIVIQHSSGTPEVMQNNPHYDNVMDDIFSILSNKINSANLAGISKENIIVDPGIGFGKTKEHNLEIIHRCGEFRSLGCPVLIGLSRKSFLGLNASDNEEKDLYTLALNSILINNNIDYIRVHNVKIHKYLLKILDSNT